MRARHEAEYFCAGLRPPCTRPRIFSTDSSIAPGGADQAESMMEQDELARTTARDRARRSRGVRSPLRTHCAAPARCGGAHAEASRAGGGLLQDCSSKSGIGPSEYHAERGSVLTWLYSVQRYLALDKLRAQRPTQAFDDELERNARRLTSPILRCSRCEATWRRACTTA